MKKILILLFCFVGFLGFAQEYRFGAASGADDQQITDLSILGNILSITIENGNTITVDLSNLTTDDNSLSEANQLITQDRNVVVSGTGTDLDIAGLIRVSIAADPNDNALYLGNLSQGLNFTINNGFEFTTPFSVYRNGSAPITRNGMLWFDTSVNKLKYWDGTQWVVTDGGTTTPNATEVPMTGYVEGTDATPPDSGDNVAEAIAKLKNITDGISASTYPSTANQQYVSYHTSKVTIHDSMFAAAALYDGRELNFTVTDTLELGNGVTSAHYNEWINFRALDLDGTGADSVLVRPVDGNKILMNGNALPTEAGNVYIALANEYGSAKKLNDSIWDLSIIDKYDGVPVAETNPFILDVPWDLYMDNTTIVSTGTTNGDAITQVTDLSGNGNNAVPGVSPTYNNGSTGPEMDFNGTEWLTLSDASVGEYTLGSDSFSVVVAEGDNVATTGYYISKAIPDSGNRLWGLFKPGASTNISILHGGTSSQFNGISANTNKVMILVFTTTTVTLYIDGAEITSYPLDTTVTSNASQPINIGARTNGEFLHNGSIRFIGVTPTALDASGRSTIFSALQVN